MKNLYCRIKELLSTNDINYKNALIALQTLNEAMINTIVLENSILNLLKHFRNKHMILQLLCLPKSNVIPLSTLCGFLSNDAVEATVLSALAIE